MFNFTKMHGIGNDFIIIDENLNLIEDKYSFAKKVCNRRTGIGADGLILIHYSNDDNVEIEIYNSDGTEASMCGNGVRCVAKYLSTKANFTVKNNTIQIRTKSGIKKIVISHIPYFSATVDMGIPSFCSNSMSLYTDKSVIFDELLQLPSGDFHITCVNVGNTHTIIFVKDLFLLPFEKIANEIQNNKLFFESTNVEFVEVVNQNNIRVRVFERGCGETLGCGTGACAAVFACIHHNKTSNIVDVTLPGGILHVFYNKATDHIFLNGPATTVYTGNFNF